MLHYAGWAPGSGPAEEFRRYGCGRAGPRTTSPRGGSSPRPLPARGCPSGSLFARAALEDASPFACDMGERLIAEQGGAVVGFIDFVSTTGSIPYLFVLPLAQGQAVGGTLLEAAEAASAGPAQITVPAVNEHALGWYLRRGYREVGRQVQDDWHGGRVVWILLAKLSRLRPG